MLVEKALQRGAKPVREFLRSLSTPGAPLEKMALWRLQNLDRLIIAAAFKDAQEKIARHDYDGGRQVYRSLIADYPNSEAATRAEAELPKIVPLAVAHYRSEAEKSYQPDDQPGIPQSKAREYFEKMYREDPDGLQADYALLNWSRALGTESKPDQAIALLNQMLQKFPQSPLRSEATYLLGFMYGSQRVRKRDQAIRWMQQVVKEFPQGKEAPEALWHIAFYYAWTNDQFKEGLPYLEQLHQKYPDSPRWKHTEKWIRIFKEKIESGGTWP